MIRKISGLFALIACMVACSKDKFQTKPSLELKSISSKTVPVDGSMNISLEFTDKEGDVNDTLFLFKVRVNKRATATVRDTLLLQVPDFPQKSKGEINLQLAYQNYLISAITPLNALPPATGKESDSLTFKLVLKDKGNHTSDTLVINDIVIKRQ